MAFMPEAHTLLTVMAVVSLGRPARIIACRPTFCPWPAPMTLPIITSSTAISRRFASHLEYCCSTGQRPSFLAVSGASSLAWAGKTGLKPALINDSRITSAPRSLAGTSFREPPKAPTAVRTPLTMTAFDMILLPPSIGLISLMLFLQPGKTKSAQCFTNRPDSRRSIPQSGCYGKNELRGGALTFLRPHPYPQPPASDQNAKPARRFHTISVWAILIFQRLSSWIHCAAAHRR
ncbi:MAG: hypothetical protein BWX45_00439 [Deltaproteobacteria bacterium ADurb.Bin002]|nr:MAG: hypothetical protein BWX45_00439 [Deltaproteobacteria bacterium ADurb.Bin002]